MFAEGVLACVFGSAQETCHQIVTNMEFVSFTWINVVFQMPERPSFPIQHFIPLVDTFSFLICMVYEERFEVIQIERGLWQWLNIIKFFLFFLCWRRVCLWSLLDLLLWLLLLYTDWLKRFDTHLDITKHFLHAWQGITSFRPSLNILHHWWLPETCIKYCLESML